MGKAFILSTIVVTAFVFAGCAAEDQSETTTTRGTSDVGTVQSGVGTGAAAAGAAAASIAPPGH